MTLIDIFEYLLTPGARRLAWKVLARDHTPYRRMKIRAALNHVDPEHEI